MNIGIVIPGYNEAKRIGTVLEDIAAVFSHIPVELDVIVVDDGSQDKTSAVAKSYKKNLPQSVTLHVLRHRTNLGKGGAAATGCEAARKLGVNLIVLMDADGQHRAEDVAKLVAVAQELTEPKLIIGSRSRTRHMPLMMRLGNGLLSGMSRVLFDIRVQDSQSGLRAFPASVYPMIRWASTQYAMETEMLIMARTSGINIIEVPIETIYHDNHKGTTPLDGIKIANTLLAWRFLRSAGRHLSESIDEPVQHVI